MDLQVGIFLIIASIAWLVVSLICIALKKDQNH